ncbi:MAG: histidinol phosphatase [Acidothermus sp.]|nr:histidinol phosphatase [Acidothermus sp.]
MRPRSLGRCRPRRAGEAAVAATVAGIPRRKGRGVTTRPTRDDDLALALELADLADSLSLPRFGVPDLQVETKPDLTPVSDADRLVERELRATLQARRPGDALVGEEFGGEVTAGRAWVVDPIDGTKNFVRGVPVWATLVALLEGGCPVVGVVSAPALAARWWAAEGAGSWTSRPGVPRRRNQVSRIRRLSEAFLSYSGLGGWGERQDRFETLTRRVWRTRAFGDFWSHVLVAEGAVDLSAEPEVSLWDVAALVVIVEQAGGRVSGVDGDPSPTSGSILCSNGVLHDEALACLNEGDGDRTPAA